MLTDFDPENDIDTIVASNVSPRDVISPPDTIDFADAAMPTSAKKAIADDISIASLFGIRVLTDVGCTVTFDIDKCVVNFNGNEIL